MTNVPYNTNIPFASNSPSQDQPRMQENTNSLKSLIEIDHVGFGNNQGGYHTVVHLTQQLVDPPVIGDSASELYAKQIQSVNLDEALFFQSGGGRKYQMTMNIDPVQSLANSISFLPGGLLMQFGFIVTNASGAAIVTLTQGYNSPATMYTVIGSTITSNRVVQINALSNTQLAIQVVNLSGVGSLAGVNWLVIGSV